MSRLLLRRNRRPSRTRPAWLAVGLGNPGAEYESTRHNAGARSADRLAQQLGARMKPSRSRALVAEAVSDGVRVLVARPTTYMNESGVAVASLLRRLRVDPEHLIVVHDDIDLAEAALQLKRGGGTAGHHGLESIEGVIGTRDFYRVRIGVGRPRSPRQDPADFVLERMGKRVAEELAVAEAEGAEAVLAIIHDGLDRAMGRFNRSGVR